MNWRELLQNRSQTREKWFLVRQAWQEFAWQVTMTFRFWFLKIFHKGIARWSVDTDMDQCGEYDVLVLLPRLWWPFGLDPRWVFSLRGFDDWTVNVSPDSLQAELWCHLEQHDPELADQLLRMNLFDVRRWAHEHASELHLPLVDYDYVTIADAMVKRREAGQYVSAWFTKFNPQLAIAEFDFRSSIMDTKITSEVGTLIGILDHKRMTYLLEVIGTVIVLWNDEPKEIELRRLTFKRDGVIVTVTEALVDNVLVSKRG